MIKVNLWGFSCWIFERLRTIWCSVMVASVFSALVFHFSCQMCRGKSHNNSNLSSNQASNQSINQSIKHSTIKQSINQQSTINQINNQRPTFNILHPASNNQLQPISYQQFNKLATTAAATTKTATTAINNQQWTISHKSISTTFSNQSLPVNIQQRQFHNNIILKQERN